MTNKNELTLEDLNKSDMWLVDNRLIEYVMNGDVVLIDSVNADEIKELEEQIQERQSELEDEENPELIRAIQKDIDAMMEQIQSFKDDDETVGPIVYIGEGSQLGYLPQFVSEKFGWR